MQLIKIDKNQENTYNQFIGAHKYGHFMQTTHWSEFKSAFGWENLGQYLIKEGTGEPLAAFPLLVRKKFGIKILYLPRGPVLMRITNRWQNFSLVHCVK